MTIWLVVRYWPGGKRENIAAFSKEEDARWCAHKEVGKDGLICLETIELDVGIS